VTIIGGGMVGIETADLLAAQGCRVTVVELEATIAREMARNNRYEILARLEERETVILTEAAIEKVSAGELVLRRHGEEMRIDPGDAVVIAIGPEPNREVVPTIEAAGIPYVLVGDCNQPGDFLTAIRDASMAALAVNHRLPARAAGQAVH
jgi:pyruvate/2-oxoglutarate dehydrogenase complex dihydrolipoamide dehydrogenase (E3) component